MDWEMKAKGLANDVRSLAFLVLGCGAVTLVMADGWRKALGVYLCLAAAGALRDARIEA